MAVIGNAPFQGLVSGGNIIDASIEGVDLSTSAIAARLGYTPVDPGAAVFSANPTISSGTANQVQFLNGSKALVGSSNMTFNGTRLTVADLADSGLTAGRVVYSATGGSLVDSAGLTFDGTNFATTGNITGNNLSVSNTNWIGWGNYNTRLAGDSVNHTLTFSLNAAEQMRLASGSLSVGPPSGAGVINLGSAAGRAQYQYINFGGAVGGTDYAWQIGRNSSTAGVGPADGFYIYDLKASATRLVINSSGNVGIGENNPGVKLAVAGSVAISGGRGSSYALLYPDWMLYNTSSGNNFTFSNYTTELVTITQSGSLLVGGTLNNSYKGIFTANSGNNVTNVLALHNGVNSAGTGTGSRLLFKLSNFEDAIEQNKFASIEGVGISAYNEDTALIFRTQSNANRGNLPTEKMRIANNGNVGIGTNNPQYKLQVDGSTYVNGTFLQSSLASYPQQSISLSVGTTAWVKLFTITSPGGCRVRYNGGSQNSEEQGEFSIKGTYVAAGTQLTWNRQTYNNSLIELRVTGSNSTPYTVWALVRTTDFVHSLNWQVIEALNSVTLHNTTGETPGTAVASLSNPGFSSTNFNHNVTVSNSVGIGTISPLASLHVATGSILSGTNPGIGISAPQFGGIAFGFDGSPNLAQIVATNPSDAQMGFYTKLNSASAPQERMRITAAGNVGIGTTPGPNLRLDVNGAVAVKELYGRDIYSVSGGNIDITDYTASNFIILEVFGSINPNAGGSSYIDPIHMYVYAGRGWNGSSLTNYIYVQHVAPPARDVYPSGGGAGNAIAAVWYNGTTELDSVDDGSSGYYVRLKAYNFNSTFGSGFNVRVIRRA